MKVNPSMITLVRDLRGLTQAQLAALLGKAQSTVSKWEIGREVEERDVERLAAVLSVDPSLFSQRQIMVGSDLMYRKRSTVDRATQRRIEAGINLRRIQVDRLLDVLGHSAIPTIFPSVDLGEFSGDPAGVACEMRRILGVPSGPVRDLTARLETHGAIVFRYDFECNGVDGTTIKWPGEPAFIFVNSRAPGDRLRFNLAHELGHLVMHQEPVSGDREEQANSFAAEFLMPAADIYTDLIGLDLAKAANLKQAWGVSIAALLLRAKELNCITEDKYRQFAQKLAVRGAVKREPVEVPIEEPSLFATLVDRAIEVLGSESMVRQTIMLTDDLGQMGPVAFLNAVPKEQGLFGTLPSQTVVKNPSLRLVDGR